jgi:hypothetical protein
MSDEPEEDEDEPEAEPSEWVQPPELLLAAFRLAESIEDIGVLLVEEGFDPTTVRVLSAWEHSEHRWSAPTRPCPGYRATTEAWKWLVSGWDVDIAGISDGCGLTREVVRERITVLQHARLIYPDGCIAKAARNAISAAITVRLKGRKGRDSSGD